MEQNLSIRNGLKKWDKKGNSPYIGSILMLNEDVPLFEEHFGQLDYDWLLKVTMNRICVKVEPCVIRYENSTNLSLDSEYRKRDFYMGLLEIDGDIKVMKRWYSTRARYHYVMNDMAMARFYFVRGALNWKTILYFVSSYNKSLSKLIVKKFNVFG